MFTSAPGIPDLKYNLDMFTSAPKLQIFQLQYFSKITYHDTNHTQKFKKKINKILIDLITIRSQ